MNPAVATATNTIEPAHPGWRVLWTRSHCEQLVNDQLLAAGLDPFLPKLQVWSRRAGTRHEIEVPMFAGYLFVAEPLERSGYQAVCRARGLVRVLGDSWDRPALVPESEMAVIRRIATSPVVARVHPYLTEGCRVRIVAGPLAGTDGLFVRSRPSRGLVVVSIEMLQRSVAVEVDGRDVEVA